MNGRQGHGIEQSDQPHGPDKQLPAAAEEGQDKQNGGVQRKRAGNQPFDAHPVVQGAAQQLPDDAAQRLRQYSQTGIRQASSQLVEDIHGNQRPHQGAACGVDEAGDEEHIQFSRIASQQIHAGLLLFSEESLRDSGN
ncbi:hypothetical protein D3C81_1784130 [compost metagenome]